MKNDLNPLNGIETLPDDDLLPVEARNLHFTPPWWCRGTHAQTLWPALMRIRPRVALRRERIELPDGDFVDLDWAADATEGPIVLVLHGLTGSFNSKYALGMLKTLTAQGWRGVILNFRGCSGEPNRLPRSYHSGETGDLAFIVETLRKREPQTSIAAIGYSLGGNALLKWLGEIHGRTLLSAAVAVSVPFMLADCAWRMERGFSRLYQWNLMRDLKGSVERKRKLMQLPLKITDIASLHTFREFDEHVTAPLHGFTGADDYYARCSSRNYLRHIATPTLIVHGKDDPFMTPAGVPLEEELSPTTRLELYDHGGHNGFVYGRWPWRAQYWVEKRAPEFLARYL